MTLESSSQGEQAGAPRRRILLVEAERDASTSVGGQLFASGYEVVKVTTEQAADAVREFLPDASLIIFGERESEGDLLALARRLRINPATYTLPLVFLFRENRRTLRSAALQIGADDYFSLATARSEICARLDALFWRVEAGRRNAPVVGEQRAEIENFLLLLEGVSADAQGGAIGTLALVGALVEEAGAGGASEREQTLAEAHGFLKLNLRRVDAVAFYGPTILLVYLPHIEEASAQAMLTRLRREFRQSSGAAGDLAFGLASFPADSVEVETLIDKAEAALNAAREQDASSRIVVSQTREAPPEPPAPTDTDGPPQHHATEPPTQQHDERPASPFKPIDQLFREIRVTDRPDSSPARRDAAHVETRAASAQAATAHTRGTGTLASRRLLLTVSDAARMSQLNLLIRSAGYEVRAAFDGQQALNLLRIENPDLLLVDYELHDMNGVEMLRRLRRQSGGQVKLPVVLLLPAQQDGARAQAVECGARGIINLPYDTVELLDCMRSVMSVD